MSAELASEPEENKFKSYLEASKPQNPDLVANFIGLQDPRQIEGMDYIRGQLEKKGFRVDSYEYKVTTKTEIRRPINPKLKNGPTERVTLEEKINVNSNFKAVRQLDWRVSKDPENILILQVTRAKGESLSLPIIFPNIIKKGRQILVNRISKVTHAQLIAKPDLKFETIPKPIEDCPELKEQLLERSKRKKGMQSTVRELLDMPGLPVSISEKIAGIATGKAIDITDTEAINIILLSDLQTRYMGLLQNFIEEVANKSTPVPGLAKQFQEMTLSLKPNYLANKFQMYFDEEVHFNDNADVFKQIFKTLQKMEEKAIIVNDKPVTKNQIFTQIKSIVVLSRSQVDPELWKRCLFLYDPDEEKNLVNKNDQVIDELVENCRKIIMSIHSAASQSLLEVYLTHNADYFMKNKFVRFDQEPFEKNEPAFFKSMVMPLLQLKSPKKGEKETIFKLFSERGIEPNKLIHPVHCMGAAYGFLIGKQILEGMQKFLQIGLNTLFHRFGKDFFEICYERIIFEAGLPVSRANFAKWLILKRIINKPEEFGYIPIENETDYDPLLTPEILAGSGQSIFPVNFTSKEFTKAFFEKQDQFIAFIQRLKGSLATQDSEFSAAQVFMDLANAGRYNFRSSGFKKQLKGTFLYDELSEVISNSCSDIKKEIEANATNRKAILKIPLAYSSILYIGSTFSVYVGDHAVQVHLMAVPVLNVEQLSDISKTFSKNMIQHLKQTNTSERKGLVQAIKILNEYIKMSLEFTRFSSILVMDRMIHHILDQEHKKSENTPLHQKYFVSDRDKLFVGNIKDINIGNLALYQIDNIKINLDELDTMAFGKALQCIGFYKSAQKTIKDKMEIIGKVMIILGRFATHLKETKEWKTYYKLIENLKQLVPQPIETLNDKKLRMLKVISDELKGMLQTSTNNDNIVNQLVGEWKRRYPSMIAKFYFYNSFLDSDQSFKDNLVLEIKQSRNFINLLKSKKSVFFFPEGSKDFQISHMNEIGNFLKKINYQGNIYVEIQNLSDEKINAITKMFYPNHFFKLNQLNPIKKTPPKA
ncbi:MAG: hypothetical protein OEY59_00295 [Deltaproteobacteria bacterium]|nr:hypothetical protein [Deltaproteobacteria bacterium]